MAISDYEVLLASLRLDWEKQPEPKEDFWPYVASRILTGFFENADDECLDWISDTISPNKAAIIAAHPDLLDTIEGELYLTDE